jgi:hypothetical protein
MSLLTNTPATGWDRLTSITREKVMPYVVNQVVKDYPLLNILLKKAVKKSGGTRIEVPITYQFKTQGSWYSGIEVLNTALENTRTRAYWAWKQLYEPLVFSNLEIFQNHGNNGEQIVDILRQEAQEVQESLKNNFATSLFSDGTGDDAKEMDGLKAATDDGAQVTTYGGITTASYSWWQSNYSALGAAISWAAMASKFDSCKSGADKPDLIVTTESVWSDLENLLEAAVRYNWGAQAPKFEGGIEDFIYFRGAKILADEYCPSGRLFMLNTKYCKLVVAAKHPKYKTDQFGFTTTDLKEPVDQDGQVGFLLWWGNLINERPSRSGQYVSIS